MEEEQVRPAQAAPGALHHPQQGEDPKRRPYDDLRWSRFKNFAPAEMFTMVDQHVFEFLRTLGGNGSTYAHHMKDARFTIPALALLAKVVDLLNQTIPSKAGDRAGIGSHSTH